MQAHNCTTDNQDAMMRNENYFLSLSYLKVPPGLVLPVYEAALSMPLVKEPSVMFCDLRRTNFVNGMEDWDLATLH